MTEVGTTVPVGGEATPPQARAPRPPTLASQVGWGLVSTALLAGWIALQNGWVWALAGVTGVLVHECGHLVVINALGCGPGRIQIIPFLGGAATMKRPPRTDFQGVLIALAGPVTGILAAAPFFVAAFATHDARWMGGAFFIALINLVNLAPAPPLDGSKALGPALAWVHPMLERAALVLVGGAAVLWAFRTGSLIFGVFVAIATLGAARRGVRRPPAERMTPIEWLAAIGLWVAALSLCLTVLAASVNRGVLASLLRLVGAH